MPRQMSADKRRVSYAEFKDVYEFLEQEAQRQRLTPTDIIRQATLRYMDVVAIEQEERKRSLRMR